MLNMYLFFILKTHEVFSKVHPWFSQGQPTFFSHELHFFIPRPTYFYGTTYNLLHFLYFLQYTTAIIYLLFYIIAIIYYILTVKLDQMTFKTVGEDESLLL